MRIASVRLHRYAGLAIAGFLSVASLTGSVLVFRVELDEWLNPELFRARSTAQTLLSPGQLAARAERADPAVEALVITPATAPGKSASVHVGPKVGAPPLKYNQVFIDPASGEILGRRMSGAIRFDRAHIMPVVFGFHYSLYVPYGKQLLGLIAIVWMLDCFVGFYLTLPRGRPFWIKWRPAWTIKSGAGPYRRNLDLHRALGLWLWLILLAVALSCIALSLKREAFLPVLSALLPTTHQMWERPPPSEPPDRLLDWDAATSRALVEARKGGWAEPIRLIYVVPNAGYYAVRFGREHKPGFDVSRIYVAIDDGRILAIEEAGRGKAGDVVADLMLPIHTGQVAGLPGRIFACIMGLVVAILSITGAYIWWKKRAPRVARRLNKSRPSGPATGEIHAAE